MMTKTKSSLVTFFAVACITSSLVQGAHDYASDKNIKAVNSVDELDKVLKAGPSLVQFFAPWCGHCQKFKDVYVKAASVLAPLGIQVVAVDGDVAKDVMQREQINGFPTVKFFLDKSKKVDYSGSRDSAASVTDFVFDTLKNAARQKLGGGSSSSGSGGGSSSGSGPIELTDSSFESRIAKGVWLVEFFAPWCGHCKQLEPTFKELARKVHSDSDFEGSVKIATVDATVHRSAAEEYQVKGFPTIKLFIDGKFVEDYNGGRDLDSLYQFVKSKKPTKKVPSVLRQMTSKKDLDECLGEKVPLCVLSFLPHLLDCDAACRKTYIKVLESEAVNGVGEGRGWLFLWSEGAVHIPLEEKLGLGPGIGYPSLAVANGKRGKTAPLRGSFGKDGIKDFLKSVIYGKQSVYPLPTDLKLSEDKVDEWDGKDFPGYPEEEGDTADEKRDAKVEL